MTIQREYDLPHLTFLGLVRALVKTCGPTSAKGLLMRDAIATGEQFPAVDYPSFEAFVAAMEGAEAPMAGIEGRANHLGNGVFGLPACPFASVVEEYVTHFGESPKGFGELVDEVNRSGRTSDRYHVGEGAAVSPFCTLHQPMRSVIGDRITVTGRKVVVYQLGCRTGAGKKGFADKWIEEGRFSRDAVDRALDEHMCCYGVRVTDEEA